MLPRPRDGAVIHKIVKGLVVRSVLAQSNGLGNLTSMLVVFVSYAALATTIPTFVNKPNITALAEIQRLQVRSYLLDMAA